MAFRPALFLNEFLEKYYFRVDIDVGIVYIKRTNINNTPNIHSMDTNHYERRNI